MKLPLMAALAALSLWGCAHESARAQPSDTSSATSAMGGSGAVDDGANTSDSKQEDGAKLDPAPDAWDANKHIGTSPASPSTGTPSDEGSGGASGR